MSNAVEERPLATRDPRSIGGRITAAGRWPWRTLRANLGLQLLALYMLFVVPALAAALAFDVLAGSRLERDVRAADLALARSIALESDAALGNALRTVARLAETPAALSLDSTVLPPLFSAVKTARDDVDLVYLLDARGIMVYHYPEGPGSTVGQGFAFRDYYDRALTANEPFMSSGRISPTTGQPVATAVMPIRARDGSFRGLVGTNIALEGLSRTLERLASDPGSGLRVSIVDATGQIVADSDASKLLSDASVELSNETNAVLSGESGSRKAADRESREWLRSYVPVPASGWAVIVQRPADIAFASPRLFHLGLLLAIGIFAAGGLFFWVMLSRRFIAPLGTLAAFSQSIGQRTVGEGGREKLGDLSARQDQVGHLTRTLDRMEQDIDRRFAELATLLDTSTAVVSTRDFDRILDTILEGVARLLNVSACAIVALDRRAGAFRIQASRGLSAEYAQNLRILPTEPSTPLMRAIRSGKPIVVNDVEVEPELPPRLRERVRAEGYRSLVATPLVTSHAPPAALLVYDHEPHVFTAEDVTLLSSLANHAAMAIENAALFALTDDKLREQTRILEALVESIGDGLILEGPSGQVVYANRRIGELAGVPFEELTRETGTSLRRRLESRSSRFAVKGEDWAGGVEELELRVDGRNVDVRLQSFDVTDAGGELIGRGQLWLDVSRDRELDRMKSALLSTVSHELRTPLAAIKGNISSLLAEDVKWDATAQREFLQVALGQADRLSQLVTDLLDLSRLEAGTLVVRREPCAIAAVVERAAVYAPPERLLLDIPAGLPLVSADPARIEVVLRNLIDNAARYSPADAPIRVSAAPSDGRVLIRVANSGPPIPPEHRDRLFEPYYRVDGGLARQTGGAGLGLSIAKGFVEAHDGRIWLETNHGETVFAFTLPVAA